MPADAGQVERTWSPNTCLRCGADLASIGVESFRVGGNTGGWKLLFGEWAELGEGLLQLDVRVCNTCRGVDFRVPERDAATR